MVARILRTTGAHTDFQTLTAELDKELWLRYPNIQQTYVPLNKITQNDLVVVAYVDDQPAACGCLRQYDPSTFEVKRMFVRNEYRGHGISKQVLKELERWTLERGIERTILETGNNQPEAVSLYKKSGYSIIENYGEYRDKRHSICMEKRLK